MPINVTKGKSSIFACIYLLIIISLTYTAAQHFPILQYAMIFILAGLGLPFVLASSFFSSRIFIGWLTYIIVVVFNVIIGDVLFENVRLLLYEMAYLFIPSSMLFYAFSKNDVLLQKRALILFAVILLLTTAATMYFTNLFPSVIKNARAYEDSQHSGFYDDMYRFGLSNYMLPHALPCLAPALVLGIKNSTFSRGLKLLLWLLLLSLVAMAYMSGSFICLVLTIVGIILSIIVKQGKLKSNIGSIYIIIFVVIVLQIPSVQHSLLDTLANNTSEDSDFYQKIEDLQKIESGSSEGTDFAIRQELYARSLSDGFSSLLIGTDGSSLGRHSSFLDRFGSLGLLGVIPLLIFVTSVVSYTLRFISSKYKVYYWIGFSLSAMMYLFKSCHSWEIWFTSLFVLPVSIKYLTCSFTK